MNKKTRTALARLREAMGAKNNEELSQKLRLSKSTLGRYYTDGIPKAQLLKAVENGYNHKWIETGQGFKFLVQSNTPTMRNGLPGESRPRCPNRPAQGIVDT